MKILLKIVGAIVLLIVAVLAYAAYANYAAERSAQAFCAETPVGSDIQLAIARAEAQHARHRGPMTTDGREEHDFGFQGWVFNMGVCRVAVASGKVISVTALMDGD